MSTDMSICVPPELASFVEQSLATGRYHSCSDVVIDGLLLLQERERSREALRAEILPSLARLDRGEGTKADSDADLDLLFDRIIDGDKRSA